MINGIIFDMDGLLIDSEPFWKAADLEVYGRLGIDLTTEFKGETTGLRVDAAVLHWYGRFPWKGKSLKEVEKEIVAHAAALIRAEGVPKPGAIALVKGLAAAGVPISVCSSSPLALIESSMEAIGLDGCFEVLHSAEGEEHGKPHPAAYLSTSRRMGLEPHTLLVFEDSLIGAIAGKAARMKVVAVPEGRDRKSSTFDFCDLTLNSLEEFDLPWFLAHRALPADRF